MATQIIEEMSPTKGHAVNGYTDVVIGGLITDKAVLKLVLTGAPPSLDLVIDELLTEGEECDEAVDFIANNRQSFASIDLDVEGTSGLVRLLNQAMALREAG
jgi:hypothetical protein